MCCPRALQRLVGGGIRGVGAAGHRPPDEHAICAFQQEGIAERASSGLSLSEDRGPLGDAPAPPKRGVGKTRLDRVGRVALYVGIHRYRHDRRPGTRGDERLLGTAGILQRQPPGAARDQGVAISPRPAGSRC